MDELAAVEAFKQRALARTTYLAAPLSSSFRTPQPAISNSHPAAYFTRTHPKRPVYEAELLSEKFRLLQLQLNLEAAKLHSPPQPSRPVDPRDRSLAESFTQTAIRAQQEAGIQTPGTEAADHEAAAATIIAHTRSDGAKSRSRTPSQAGSALSSRSATATPNLEPLPWPLQSQSYSLRQPSGSSRPLPVLPEDVTKLRHQIGEMERQIQELTLLSQMTPRGRPGDEAASKEGEVEGLRQELQEVIRVLADVIAGSNAALSPAKPGAAGPSDRGPSPIRRQQLTSPAGVTVAQPSPLRGQLAAELVGLLHSAQQQQQPSARRLFDAEDSESGEGYRSSYLQRRRADLILGNERNSGKATRDSSVQASSPGLGPTRAEMEVHELKTRLVEAESHAAFLIDQVRERDELLESARVQVKESERRLSEAWRASEAERAELQALREETAFYREQMNSENELFERELQASRDRVVELEEMNARLQHQVQRYSDALRAAMSAEEELKHLRASAERLARGGQSLWEEALRLSSPQNPGGGSPGTSGPAPVQPSPSPETQRLDRLGSRLKDEVSALKQLILKAQVEGAIGQGAIDGCGVQ